ncbi:heterodisulfide reductase, partial [Desulfobulbus sp. Tol-SR]
DFTVTVKESPRFVDMDKCIACGACAEKCPKKVDSEYDAGTGKRKAIYVKYAQAVPLKYQIDPASCIRLQKPGACGFCEKVCDAGAINFDDTEKTHQINVGAVILAPGFEAYDPKPAQVWGYGTMPNVITALQLERYLSASGPTEGHLVRPSDGKPVTKVAFLQCIGSRDENLCGNGYCSSVCCMYAIKEAVIAKDHVPGLATTIFYMDMRTHGKDFDKYLERARDESNVRFVRCRVNGVEPQGPNGDLRIHYINEKGRQVEEYYDMVVLSVGLQTPKHVLDLAETTGIQLTADKFAATSDFAPVQTSQAGIFTCGAFAGPKDIPQSVVEGSAAAAAVADLLSPARHELTSEATFPEEKDISAEDPRIGVFVCHCGSNIAGVVDVEAVEDYAATLPNVVYVERNLFSCSQDTQEQITKRIQEQNLNRIVIAACTPRTHEPLFRETLKAAGLNEYLVEMANIRNHNSWVHSKDPSHATAKAKDLVRMAAAKVTYGTSLQPIAVPITRTALVVGGGVAGMTAALNLAEQGFEVNLVERTETLGGNALYLKHTWSGEHIPTRVAKLVDKVVWNDKITIHKGSEVTAVDGFVGNFRSTITSTSGISTVIEHGVGIIATGGNIYSPTEYGYNEIKRVVTSIEFDKLHELKEKHIKSSKNFVYIQCVGSRESGNHVNVEVWDHVLHRPLKIKADMVILASAIRPKADAADLAKLYKIPVDGDGFFQEAHAKLRPVDFSTDGMFVAGIAHYPKPIEESVAQALAASARAATLLSKSQVSLDAVKATVDPDYCDGCALCIDVCPYNAITLTTIEAGVEGGEGKRIISVNKAQCKGCGLCQGTCPKRGVYIAGFTMKQISSQIQAALAV